MDRTMNALQKDLRIFLKAQAGSSDPSYKTKSKTKAYDKLDTSIDKFKAKSSITARQQEYKVRSHQYFAQPHQFLAKPSYTKTAEQKLEVYPKTRGYKSAEQETASIEDVSLQTKELFKAVAQPIISETIQQQLAAMPSFITDYPSKERLIQREEGLGEQIRHIQSLKQELLEKTSIGLESAKTFERELALSQAEGRYESPTQAIIETHAKIQTDLLTQLRDEVENLPSNLQQPKPFELTKPEDRPEIEYQLQPKPEPEPAPDPEFAPQPHPLPEPQPELEIPPTFPPTIPGGPSLSPPKLSPTLPLVPPYLRPPRFSSEPPKTVTPKKPDLDDPKKKKTRPSAEQLAGSVTYRQGFMWVTLMPPTYEGEDVLYTKLPPPNVVRATGPKSAYKTIQSIWGQAPPMIRHKMGFMESQITKGSDIQFRSLKGVD